MIFENLILIVTCLLISCENKPVQGLLKKKEKEKVCVINADFFKSSKSKIKNCTKLEISCEDMNNIPMEKLSDIIKVSNSINTLTIYNLGEPFFIEDGDLRNSLRYIGEVWVTDKTWKITYAKEIQKLKNDNRKLIDSIKSIPTLKTLNIETPVMEYNYMEKIVDDIIVNIPYLEKISINLTLGVKYAEGGIAESIERFPLCPIPDFVISKDWKRISPNSYQLTIKNIGSCNVFSKIAENTSITEIEIINGFINAKDIKRMFTKKNKITTLNLIECYLFNMKALQNLKYNNLKVLNFKIDSLTQKNLSIITNIITNNNSLIELKVWHQELPGAQEFFQHYGNIEGKLSLKHFYKAVNNNQDLEILYIENLTHDQSQIKFLVDTINTNKNLKELGVFVDNKEAISYLNNNLKNNEKIKYIHFSTYFIDEEIANILIESFKKMINLNKIRIYKAHVTLKAKNVFNSSRYKKIIEYERIYEFGRSGSFLQYTLEEMIRDQHCFWDDLYLVSLMGKSSPFFCKRVTLVIPMLKRNIETLNKLPVKEIQIKLLQNVLKKSASGFMTDYSTFDYTRFLSNTLSKNKTIEKLALMTEDVFDDEIFLMIYKSFEKMEKLEHLEINLNDVSEKNLPELCKTITKIKNLKRLRIILWENLDYDEENIDFDAAQANKFTLLMKAIGRNNKIKTLDIVGNIISRWKDDLDDYAKNEILYFVEEINKIKSLKNLNILSYEEDVDKFLWKSLSESGALVRMDVKITADDFPEDQWRDMRFRDQIINF